MSEIASALQTKKARIGWIGTGVMGRSMAGHILNAGFPLTVYNRTKSKADVLIERGARWADSPMAVAAQSDIVFTMVGFPRDVRETITGEEGVLQGLTQGGICIDMTTSEPSLAREIAQVALEKGFVSLDAPVSGGDIGAREARLSIMVGGDYETYQLLTPLWQAMGKTIVYQGAPGAGQHCKLTNQILVSGIMVSMCEALLYAYRSGGDLNRVLESVSSGAAGSWSLTNLGPKILLGDYAPGFFVDHFVKDLGLTVVECERMGIQLPGLKLANELYRKLQELGHGQKGTQALILSLAHMNDLDWNNR